MSSTKQDWTPEPWITDGSKVEGNSPGAMHDIAHCPTHPHLDWTGTDNANRIVACVNPLAGIPDPAAELKRLRDVAREQHAWEEMAERLGLPLKAEGAEPYLKAMKEVVTAAEAVKSTIGTDGKITWTHANAVWLLKAVDTLRTLSTPESEAKPCP